MAKVEIYTGAFCGFCGRAKSLLNRIGQSFEEIDVTMDAAKRTEMTRRSGGRTSVPQIFINGSHIGGSDDLSALERDGTLAGLLDR